MHNAVRQVQALAGLKQFNKVGSIPELQRLEEALAVAQHHDAASGTAKQHVTFDYQRRIAAGLLQSDGVLSAGLDVLTGTQTGWKQCDRMNETVCSITQTSNNTVTVSIWNQMAQSRVELITIPVNSSQVSVVDASGAAIPVQINPARETLSNYQRDTKEAMLEASFQVTLPAVGVATFTITQTATGSSSQSDTHHLAGSHVSSDITIENELISLTFSGISGLLQSMSNKRTGTTISMVQSFCYYKGNTGDSKSGQASGAYIFRPDSSGHCFPVAVGNVSIRVLKGTLSQEIRQVFGVQADGVTPWLSQTVRLGAGQRHAQFEFTVGEIPIPDPAHNQTTEKCVAWRQTAGCDPSGTRQPANDKTCGQWVDGTNSGFCECANGRKTSVVGCGYPGFTCADMCAFRNGKEIVSRFNTSIASASELLTDSNGRDMLHRKRNWRPSWNLSQTEEIAGNYYPINSAIAIKDGFSQLTVLVDRAQGGGSVADGVLELMIHRRLLVDDSRGVSEPLNETQFTASYVGKPLHWGGQASGHGLVIRGSHFVTLEPPANASAIWRPLADRVFAKPVLGFRSGAVVHNQATTRSFSSALSRPLPDNVQLMTLQALSKGQFLLRLSHQFGIHEDAVLSVPVQVDLSTMFNPNVLELTHTPPHALLTMAREMSLTNNQKKSEIVARRKLNQQWNLERPTRAPHPWRQAPFDFAKSPLVTLGPLEVKTFVLSVKSTSRS